MAIYKKTWLWVVFGSIIFVAVVVSLLPVVIKSYTEDWYLAQGVKHVEIGDIDFNVFTGVLVVEAMQVKDETGVVFSMAEAAVNLAVLDLFSKKVLVESLNFRQLKININRLADKPVNIGGIVLGGSEPQKKVEPEGEKAGWGLGITNTFIEELTVNYQDDKITTQITLHNASLNKALTWTPQDTANLVINGEVNGSAVLITADIKPFAENPSFKGHLKIDGINVEGFSGLVRPGVQELTGTLNVDAKFDVNYAANKSVALKTKGQYQLDQGDIRLKGQRIKSSNFNIEGALEFQQSLKSADTESALKFFGDLRADNISVTDRIKKITLARADKVAITNGEINNLNDISIEKALFEQFEGISKQGKDSAKATDKLLRVSSATIENVKLVELDQLSISKISIAQIVGNITKDKSGKLLLLDEFSSKKQPVENKAVDSQSVASGAPSTKEETGGFKFKIGVVEVSDKSRLTFRDASVIPKFEINMKIKSLALSNIDNSKKENESRFSLNGKLDKYSTIEANGKVKLFSDINDFSVVARVEKYELPHLSSYTSQVLGYDLVSGQGDVNLKVDRSGDKIDGEAKLKLHNLTVKETNPEHMKELNEQLSIPLSSALSMLRDKNDDIKLTIPVTGKFLEPDVGIGDVINTALGKALKGSTLSYLKYTFQPYGTLISIVQLAGSVASSIQLDPVLFESGESEMDDEAIEYLYKIAEVLKDRQKIRIKLCGVSTEEDRFVLNEEAGRSKKPQITNDDLFALAKKRAENVKDYLVDQFKVDPARLFVCHPEIKTEETAKSVVELLI